MTHPVMQRLHDDHSNFRRIMSLLLGELERLEDADDRDLALVQEIMRYMVHYADRFHHPLEDEVYVLLQRRDHSDDVLRLEQEHEQLEATGEALRTRVHLPDAGLADWPQLAADLRDYASTLNRHKDLEESKVFPLAKVLLTEDEFDRIREGFAWLEDPVFGGGLAEGYRVLGERLLELTTPASR